MAEQGKRIGPNADAKQPGTEKTVPTDIKSALASQAKQPANKQVNTPKKKTDVTDITILTAISSSINQIIKSLKLQQNTNSKINSDISDNNKILQNILSKLESNKNENKIGLNTNDNISVNSISDDTIKKFINTFKSEVLDSISNNVSSINKKLDDLNNANKFDADAVLSTFLTDYKTITNSLIETFKTEKLDTKVLNEAILKFNDLAIKNDITILTDKLEKYFNNSTDILSNIDNTLTTNFKSAVDNFGNTKGNATNNNVNNSVNSSLISEIEIKSLVDEYTKSINETSVVFSQDEINKFVTSIEKSPVISNLNYLPEIANNLEFKKIEDLINKSIDSIKAELTENISKSHTSLSKINSTTENIVFNRVRKMTPEDYEIQSTQKDIISKEKKSLFSLFKTKPKNQPIIQQKTIGIQPSTSDIVQTTIVPSNNFLNQQSDAINSALLISDAKQNSLVDDQRNTWTSIAYEQQERIISVLSAMDRTLSSMKTDLYNYFEGVKNERERKNRYATSIKSDTNVSKNEINSIFDNTDRNDSSLNSISQSDVGEVAAGGGGISSFIGTALDLIPGKGKVLGKVGSLAKGLFKGKVAGKALGAVSKLGGKGLLAGGAKIGSKVGLKAGAKVAARLGAGALKAIPGIGLAVTAGMAAYDAYNGWNNAAEITGKKDEELTWQDKLAAAGASAASGLTFGLVSPEKMYEWGNKISAVTKWANPAYQVYRGGKAIFSWLNSNQKKENADVLLKQEQDRVDKLNAEQKTENDAEIARIKEKLANGAAISKTEELQLNRGTAEGEKAYQDHISNKDNLIKMDDKELFNVKTMAENELDRQKTKTQLELDSANAAKDAALEKTNAEKVSNALNPLVWFGLSEKDGELPLLLKNKKFRERAESSDIAQIQKSITYLDKEIADVTKRKNERSIFNVFGKTKDISELNKLIHYKEAIQKRLKALTDLKQKEEQVQAINDVREQKKEEALKIDTVKTGQTDSIEFEDNTDNIITDDTLDIEAAATGTNMSEIPQNSEEILSVTENDMEIKTGLNNDDAKEKIKELQRLNDITNNITQEKTKTADKTNEMLLLQLQKRDAVMDSYLNPSSPTSVAKVMESSMNNIANKVQPIYSFPPTRTQNINRPTTLL